jgi:hypothetical protein
MGDDRSGRKVWIDPCFLLVRNRAFSVDVTWLGWESLRVWLAAACNSMLDEKGVCGWNGWFVGASEVSEGVRGLNTHELSWLCLQICQVVLGVVDRIIPRCFQTTVAPVLETRGTILVVLAGSDCRRTNSRGLYTLGKANIGRYSQFGLLASRGSSRRRGLLRPCVCRRTFFGVEHLRRRSSEPRLRS